MMTLVVRVCTAIILLFMLPCSCSSHRLGVIKNPTCGGDCVAAVMMAVNDLSNGMWNVSMNLRPVFIPAGNPHLLNTSKLSSLDVVLSSTIDTTRSLPDVLSTLSLPLMDYQSSDPAYSDSLRYPSLTRMAAVASLQGEVLADVFKSYQWSHIVVLASQEVYWQHILSSLRHFAASHEISLDVYHPLTLSPTELHALLRHIKSSWRHIYLLLMYPTDAATILLAAQDVDLLRIGTQLVGPTELSNYGAINTYIQRGVDSAIIHGYLGINSHVSAEGVLGADFVTRWRAQSATRIDDDDGSVWCSNATDDDGQYIYYDATSPQNCSGLNFSSFAVDGSDIHSSAILAYDATISLALAIHTLVSQNITLSASSVFEAITLLVRRGVSGIIGFNDELYYGSGDRSGGLKYQLLNYQDRDGNLSFVVIGNYNSETGLSLCNRNDSSCICGLYNTRDPSHPPLDTRYVVQRMAPEYRYSLFMLSLTCGCVIFFIYVFIVLHSHALTKIDSDNKS